MERVWAYFYALEREQQMAILSVCLFVTFGTSVPDMLVALFLAGSVPFTEVNIPWLVMLILYLESGSFLFRYTMRHGLYPGSPRIEKAHAKILARNLRNQRRREAYARMKAAERRRMAVPLSPVNRAINHPQSLPPTPPHRSSPARRPQVA